MDSLSNNSQRKGKGTGRRKIKMQKIENEANLQVTFSKRRAGLFKKASELDTLCGTESAVVAFSPSDKVHSYGNPDVETITDMYVNQAEGYINHQNPGAHHNAMARQRNQKVTDLERQLELEKRYKKELNKMREASQGQYGAPPNIEDLTYQQLEELKKAVLAFKEDFEAKMQNPVGPDNSYMVVHGQNPNPAYGGGFPSGGSNMQVQPFQNNMDAANFSNYQTLNHSQAVQPFQNNVVVEPSYNNPSETFFSDMLAANNGYVDPFDPIMEPSFQFDHVANDSNLLPFGGGELATTSNAAEADQNGFAPYWGGPQGYLQNNNQGFQNNYDGGY